jgi:hypothetical protein
VGITATGFCYPDMILQLFHRQDQEILRLSTTAEAGSSTFSIDKINKFFDCR